MQKNEHQQNQVYRPLIDDIELQKNIQYLDWQFRVQNKQYVLDFLIDRGSADPRIFRCSFMLLPVTNLTLTSIGMPFGGILRPLFTPPEQAPQAPLYDNASWICRCGNYFSPSSYVKNDRLYCDVCRVSKHATGVVDENLLKKGVVDLLVGEREETLYYVVLFEVSKATVETGVLQTMLQALRAGAAALIGEHIRFVFIGHTSLQARFYRFDQQTQEMSVILNREFSDLPNQISNFSCSLENCEPFISQLIQHIDEMGYMLIETPHDFLPDLLSMIIRNQAHFLKKIMVLSTRGAHAGQFKTGQLNVLKNKTNLMFGTEDNKFNNLCALISKFGDNCSLDLFCFPGSIMNLEDLKSPFILSGGSINMYENSSSSQISTLYYDAYRVVTRKTVFRVELVCRASSGIIIRAIGLNHILKVRRTIELNSLNEDQTLSIFLAMDEYIFDILRKLMSNKPSLQFVMSYQTSLGKYKRIIHYNVFRVKDNYQVMAGFDPEAAVRLLATNILHEKHLAREAKGCHKKLRDTIKKFKEFHFLMKDKLLEQYQFKQKDKSVKRASPKDLTIRYDESYGLFLCHMFYLINRTHVFQVTSQVYPWQVTFQQYFLLTNPISITSKVLYPRVYEILQCDLRDKRTFQEMAATIPAQLSVMEKGGIYVFDKGYKLFMIINNESSEYLQEVFGTADHKQIQAMNSLDGQTEINQVLSQFIQQLRKHNRDGCQPLQIIIGDKFYKYEKQLLTEDSYYCDASDNYEFFMRQHTEQS